MRHRETTQALQDADHAADREGEMAARTKRRVMELLTRRTALAALASCAAALALGAVTAQARWVIHGRAFGHGAGMSQYGAYGYAQHGRGYRWILEHYYQGAVVGTVADGRTIRVLLDDGVDPIRFSGADRACGRDLRPARDYRFQRRTDSVLLKNDAGHRLANCGTAGTASGGASVALEPGGRYRGKIEGRIGQGAGLALINEVGVDGYVQGVVPNEMPASWAAAALRAQAVAARSYALATSVGGSFDVYDDTRSQVYGGLDSEVAATNAAARDTAGEVVRFDGRIATTYFFSTSGGRTESVQFAFPGAEPQPYLKSVRDRYDAISPFHTWTVRYSQGAMESRLGGLFAGNLRRIRILETGDSPRIVRARVVGSGDSSVVSGGTLAARLSLRSTWARFDNKALGGGGGGGSGGIGG